MLRRIVLGTMVGGGKEVFAAEGLRTMLTLEWEEVDEETRRVGALLADVEELFFACGGGGTRHGRGGIQELGVGMRESCCG